MPATQLIPGPIPLSHVTIQWQPALQKLSPNVQAHIEACWSRHLAAARTQGRNLFNGPILTLRDHACRNSQVTLTLAPSDYKTFLVTCVRNRDWFLTHAPNALTPALGSSALLTHNDTAFLGVRSQRVSAYPGKIHLFGGVLDTADRPPTAASLLAHLQRELSEELALSSADFAGPPVLLGLFTDPALFQPELVWHCPLRQPISQIDPKEHDALFAQPLHSPADASACTPVAFSALQLLRRYFARGA